MTDQPYSSGNGAGRGVTRAGVWSIGGKLSAKLIDLATLIILTGILEPADFGLVAKAMTVILILEAVTSVPIEAPILRIKSPDASIYDTAFTLNIIRAAIIYLAIAFLAAPLSVYFQEDRLPALLLVLAAAPSLRGCTSPRMADFVRRYHMRPEAIMDISSKAVSLVAVVAVASLTGSYWAIAVGTVTTTLILNLLSYIFAPYRPRLSLGRWRQFSDIVTWNTLAQMLQVMNWQLDQLLLGRFLDTASFGRYSVSRTICEIPEQTITLPLSRAMVASFTQVETDAARRDIWLTFSNGMLYAVGPLLVLLALLAGNVVHVLLGPGWENAAIYIAGLALAGIPALPVVPMIPLAVSIYQAKLIVLRIGVQFAVSVPLITAAILLAGALGAIAAKMLVGVIMLVFVARLVRRLIDLPLREQAASLWRTVLSLVLLAAMMLVFGDVYAIPPETSRALAALHLIVVSLAALAAYAAMSLVIWRLCGAPKSIEAFIFGFIRDRFSGKRKETEA